MRYAELRICLASFSAALCLGALFTFNNLFSCVGYYLDDVNNATEN